MPATMRTPKHGDIRTTHDIGDIIDVEIYDDRERRYGPYRRTREELITDVGQKVADDYISSREDDGSAMCWKWIGQIHQSPTSRRVLFVSSDDSVRKTFENLPIAIEQLMILGQKGRL